jgi:hypothetical protein
MGRSIVFPYTKKSFGDLAYIYIYIYIKNDVILPETTPF